MKSIDVKALGKAMVWTSGVMLTAIGVALLTRWLGSGVLFAFNVVFLVMLFYVILKD